MDWKAALDRWITREPDCSFDNWCELVDEEFTEIFGYDNERWITDYDGQCSKWLNTLHIKGHDPKQAAAIIERAFKIHNL